MSSTLERIRKLMADRKLSANKVTQILEISNSTFTDWNKGKAKPNLDTMIKLSNFFDVSLDYLVFGEDRGAPTVQDENKFFDSLTSEDVELLTKYHSLPAEHKGKLNAFLDGMLAATEKVEERDARLLG